MILVLKGERWQRSAVEPVVDTPFPPSSSQLSVSFIPLHAGSPFLTDTALPRLLHFVTTPKPRANASEMFPAKFKELCVASSCLHHFKKHT